MKKQEQKYFEWLVNIITDNHPNLGISWFSRLLEHMYNVEFIWLIDMDVNRAEDGLSLRYRYSKDFELKKKCSLLEMMVALALRCEESIMDNPKYGNRTSQWFWIMISNMGLGGMTDDNYDDEYVEYIIDRFLNREYFPDGKGGLFIIKDCPYDVRELEIWVQLSWYMNSMPW